jgi:hypothetical protein
MPGPTRVRRSLSDWLSNFDSPHVESERAIRGGLVETDVYPTHDQRPMIGHSCTEAEVVKEIGAS